MKAISEKKAYLKPVVTDVRVFDSDCLGGGSEGGKDSAPEEDAAKGNGWDYGTADWHDDDGLDW